MKQTPMEECIELLLLSAKDSRLSKAVFSKPLSRDVKKTVLTVRMIKGERMLQAETFTTDNKAYHKNIPLCEAADVLVELMAGYAQVNVLCEGASAEWRCSKSGTQTLIGGAKLRSALADGRTAVVDTAGNNLSKKHILDGTEPFLKMLGISDGNGRIYDKKHMKFRQINRFVELVRDVSEHLPSKEIYICDLCCGKSYLSFAVYHYFANVLGLTTHMTGVDLKADVVSYCNEVAQKLGFEGLHFVCGDVAAFEVAHKPDLVVSLHACDVATDIVLEKAVAWQTPVILSTPCCHHEMNRLLNCKALSFVSEHSMLRQKLCDAVTDALRLKWLGSHGYRTSALELVEDAPKNILLRAVRLPDNEETKRAMERARREYDEARRYLCDDSRIGLLEDGQSMFSKS